MTIIDAQVHVWPPETSERHSASRSYRQAVTLFTEELDFLSSADKKWIMGRALAEWLRWPI